MRLCVLGAVAGCAMVAAGALAQAPASASDASVAMLEKARTLSNLHQAGTPSYRLQATFETYDYKGVADGSGAMTEVFLRDGYWQRSVKYRDHRSQTTMVNGESRTVSDPEYMSSFALNAVLRDLLEPLPSHETLARYTFKTTPMKAGAATLTCVVGSLPYKVATSAAIVDWGKSGTLSAHNERLEAIGTAPNEAFCLDAEPPIVRVLQGHHGRMITFNRVVRLGALYVPGDITMMEGGKMRAHLHVDAIAPTPSMTENDIVLPAANAGGAQPVSGAMVAGRLVHSERAMYPPLAAERHIQGTVTLHGLIGKDGHVRDLELVSAPDDLLVEAAMTAVRQWVYQPYTLAGVPVEVDTIININFSR